MNNINAGFATNIKAIPTTLDIEKVDAMIAVIKARNVFSAQAAVGKTLEVIMKNKGKS